ncbi:MAG: hypothetical protein ABI234_11960 [Ktedonobacteraceae bacterium]
MLNREEIEQIINEKLEPITEEIAALKAQLSKVDLLAIDNRNIRQSLGRIETAQGGFKTAQEGLKLDVERQEKRIIRFEKQTNDQFTDLKADNTIIKEQLSLVVTMLHRVLPLEEQR